MIKLHQPLNTLRFFKGFFIILLSFFMSCDLKGPASFKMPTWYFDLMFPLVQQKYSLEGMVDNKQIFSTPDSLGMQLMFEGSFPDTSIGADILEIDLDKSIKFSTQATSAPNFSFALDTSIKISYPVAPGSKLTNTNGDQFDVPPTVDQTISLASWNAIAQATAPTLNVEIPISSIPNDQLPDLVESVIGYRIKTDAGASTSSFTSKFTNNGLPSNVTLADARLKTEIDSKDITLALHQDDGCCGVVDKGNNVSESTSLSDSTIGSKLIIPVSFQISDASEI